MTKTLIPSLKLLFILLIVYLSYSFMAHPSTLITNYTLTRPDTISILPDTLREISGITMLDATTIACIQDENGILFTYDLLQQKIKSQHVFYSNGDYEGIARVEQTLYVLRSDGLLFEISEGLSSKPKLNTYFTGIPSGNNEGLCYDYDKHRLLIACKGKLSKTPVDKNKRAIYAFDLKTKLLSKHPVYTFDLNVIKAFASEHDIRLPLKNTQKSTAVKPLLKFNISAIAIHPMTKKLYVISSTDPFLFVFNTEGLLEAMEPLDPILFNQAEGITFLPQGDLLISNEGNPKKATLLRFNYHHKE